MVCSALGDHEDAELQQALALSLLECQPGQRQAVQQGAAPSPLGQQAQQQEQEQAEDVDDECLDFDPLLFIKRLPPLERCVPPRREFLLPKKTRRSKQKT